MFFSKFYVNKITSYLNVCFSDTCGTLRERSFKVQLQKIALLPLVAQGKKTLEVEEITGYRRTWIYALVKRYNELGISGLCDHRSQNQRAKPLIEDVEQARLWQVLQDNAPDGGLWNGRKVADWLSEVTQTKVSRQRGWEILPQMTFRLRVPRPCHTKSDFFEQSAWKKN